jgi:isoprenylcysteine carboxyl methyltransferase (ICMT) family protein YpbQ
MFFFFFVCGLIIDLLTRFRLNVPGIENIGLLLLIVSSFLIYWAQSVNKRPKLLPDGTRNFAYGPYAFSRHPTYLGVFVLTLGAAFIMSSVSILVTSILAYAISVFTVMEKEEKRHIKNLIFYLGIPFLLIIIEPNLSTAILVSAIVGSIYYISGGDVFPLLGMVVVILLLSNIIYLFCY